MNSLRRGAAAALLMAGAAVPALGQAAIPAIRVGQTVNGTLAESDPTPKERGRFKVYRFEAAAGRPYLVTLRSGEFDAYLRVARNMGGITDVLKEDDDHGGNTDARLRFQAAEAGTYLIVAQSLEAEGKGAFTLQLADAPMPVNTAPRPVQLNQAVQGALSETDAVEEDETYYDSYTIRGRAGQRLQIEMESDSFDTYLNIGRMENGQFVSKSTDDDGAGEGTNSRMRMTLEEDGEYIIRANSVNVGTGPYTLRVTERAASRPATPQAIRAGADVQGTLADGDAETDEGVMYDYWTYTGRAGEALTITMASSEFDTMLAVGRMENGQFQEISNNDDGPDGTNSRLEVTLPANGQYVIRTSALAAEGTGAYTVRVESAAPR
ncbi:MAG TPA: PPC domain-containing protein [Longimicrobium sp.]|jgi:hypothetical protein